jgi:hypothetical protein
MPTLMIVQVELKRNYDHEESDDGSRHSQLHLGASRTNFGAIGISDGPPNPLRTEETFERSGRIPSVSTP